MDGVGQLELRLLVVAFDPSEHLLSCFCIHARLKLVGPRKEQRNERLLMIGRFAADAEWRVVVLAAITAFAVGLGLAAWSWISRLAALIIVAMLIVLFAALLPGDSPIDNRIRGC